MLSPDEFTVGTIGSAKPGSLILPRTKYEAVVLIGETEEGPAAVFLSGQYRFLYFPSSGNSRWNGLIIPGVRVEVDETNLFDPNSDDGPLGSVVRIDTRLVIRARTEHPFRRSTPVALQSGLEPIDEGGAGFIKWRVVIGEAQNKRILLDVDVIETAPS